MFDFIRKKKDRSMLTKTIRTEVGYSGRKMLFGRLMLGQDDADRFKQRFGLATHMSEREMVSFHGTIHLRELLNSMQRRLADTPDTPSTRHAVSSPALVCALPLLK